MSQIDAHYDHAIIGSGISGLLCAAYLAKKGKKVIVLEKNHQIGGCLQVFSRDKKIFDTGVHYVGSLGKGQPLRHLFDFIGIGDLLKYQRLDMDGFDRIYFEDEQIEYKFGQGWDNFISGLSKYFPEESENLLLLLEEINRIVSLFGPYHLKELEENSVTIEILSLSAYEVISSFITSERLIAVLWGNSILYAGNKAKTPFYVFALILNSYVEGSYRLIHGGSQISKYLSMIIHDNGGLVRKYAEVTSIEIKEGKVDKVIIDQNISVNVSTCIAAIHPACVIGLLPEYSLRPSYVSRVKELQNTPAFISVYFSLKENALPYFNYNTYILKNNDAAMHPDGHFDDNWPTNMMISTGCEEHDQQYANTINVLAYCDVKIFKKWESTFNTTAKHQERGQDYDQLKKELINKIAKKVASKISGFEDMYFAAYCSTPLTYRDFLNVPDGTGYGVEKDYNNTLFTFISPKMKIPNLLMTGQNTDLHGVYGASISALLTLKHTSEGKLIFEEINEFLNN